MSKRKVTDDLTLVGFDDIFQSTVVADDTNSVNTISSANNTPPDTDSIIATNDGNDGIVTPAIFTAITSHDTIETYHKSNEAYTETITHIPLMVCTAKIIQTHQIIQQQMS